MSNHTSNSPARLRIWQQNLNASMISQASLLNNSKLATDWDLIVIQEPYINFLRNTCANHHWHVLYPSEHFTNPQRRSRAITLVNSSINTNHWKQIPFPSSDVVVMQMNGPYGCCSIFNIYNDCNSQDTLTALDTYLEVNIATIRPTETDHMLWLGDFNRHHPLWEDIRNRHLFNYAAANPLIDLIANYGMLQLLPCGIPTLQANNTGNWTRPDNVLGTETIVDSLISCDTDPSQRGPRTDHVPILLTLELDTSKLSTEPRRNWRETDWEAFNEHLSKILEPFPPTPLASEEEFQQAAHRITGAITSAMEATVPFTKPCPHSKRWWTKDLTILRKQVNEASRLAYQLRGLPEHACHDELKSIKNRYAEEIESTKKQHWIEWLEDIEGNDLWTANKYISSAPKDGGKTRIPTLNTRRPDGTPIEAITNQEKSTILAESFFPPPPTNDSVPETVYPDPVARHTPFRRDEITRAIAKLSGYKAPGPDGICNIVYKRCADVLVPYLTHLFNGAFTHHTFYEPWKRFTTVVLRKPGKPNYSTPKAFRPIALLNTLGKLLTAVVAERLTFTLERYQLLPQTHFGGRPGRSTTDSLHLLEETIKNAWRNHKVASVLFLDIEGAFPNAVTKRLIHNMRMRRIPGELIAFTERLLTHRQTQLKFDGFTSDWIPINNGIGQGDPLSMILYIIYSSDLVDVARTRRGNEALKELTLAFVDDTAFIAIGKSFEDTHEILADMLERPGGGYEWSRAHNSKFETNKFALMDFSMNRQRNRPNMHIQGSVIRPTATHRFLGVIVDQELRWNAQVDHATAKGLAYVLQLRRLATTAKGLPMRLMRQLYQAVAVPKMLYAADLWSYCDGSDIPQRGSIGVAKRLTSIQRIAATAITGALRTTATDVLEAHANLLPIPLLLQNTCHRAIVRIAAHPITHPLYTPIRRAASRFVRSHRTSLHRLTRQYRIKPAEIESLIPDRRSPTSSNSYQTHIATSKPQAIQDHNANTDSIQVYSDGSGHQGQIGAAAILFRAGRTPRKLLFHLGTDEEHTVFEAEAVGLALAAELIATEEDITYPASIFVDNQAVIQAGESFYSNPGSYLIDRFRERLNMLARGGNNFQVTLRWLPGHSDIHGNEEADKQAKRAAEGRHNNSPAATLPDFLRYNTLPLSISALQQAHHKTTAERWKRLWCKSPRYNRINRIDPNLLHRSFLKLTANFPKRLTSLYIALRTQHIPLRRYLHRIGKAPSPSCPHCPNVDETVPHYLLDCPHYRRERHALLLALGRDATSLSFLLSDSSATPHLVRFINSTNRLSKTLGEVPLPRKPPD